MRFNSAFRELKLSTGLRAGRRTRALTAGNPPDFGSLPLLSFLFWLVLRCEPWVDTVEDLWREPEHRKGERWKGREDIDTVVLATSLAPQWFSRSDAR